jgi:MFS family permease
MLGTLFGGLAMAHLGWRAMFVGLGTITFFWLWPWLVVTRGTALQAPEEHDSGSISYAAILQRREFWGAALGQFLINYAFYFVLTWLPSFLVKAGGFNRLGDGGHRRPRSTASMRWRRSSRGRHPIAGSGAAARRRSCARRFC